MKRFRERQRKNVADKEIEGEKEVDIPWFTQKANKDPDKGLALLTEAAGALLAD